MIVMKYKFKIKRFISAVTASAMIAALLPAQVLRADEASAVYIFVDGFLLETDAPPFVESGHTLIGMRDLFEVLGADVKWEPVFQKVYATKGDMNVSITIGSEQATVREAEYTMPIEPKLVNGHTMVPLRFISESFKAKVDWDPQTNSVLIDTDAADYSALAADRTKNTTVTSEEISYERAVGRLFETSNDLKNQLDNKKLWEDSLDDARDAYRRNNNFNLEFARSARTIQTLENLLKNFDESLQNSKDLLELSFRQLLTKIETAEMDIYLLRQKIAIEEKELLNLELKLSLGMANENEINLAEKSLSQSNGQLANAEISLNKAKLEVNTLLGYKADHEIKVMWPEYEGTPQDDLDSYVKRQQATSYAIRQKEIALSEAEYVIYTHDKFLDSDYRDMENIIELENKVSSAERALVQTKTDIEKIIRQNYNDILSQEESYKNLQTEYDKAVDTYMNVVANLQTGRATFLNLENARLGILSAEINMSKNRMNLSDLLHGFEKPHLQLLKPQTSSVN